MTYVAGWNYAFTFYRSGSYIYLKYVNFMPYGMGLNLHIRNGSSGTSPSVSDTIGRTVTACVAHSSISGNLKYNRSGTSGFSTRIVGTNGHSALAGDACRSDTDHSQDYTLGSAYGSRP